MYLFRFHMTPKPGTSHAKKCIGAYANVWINFGYRDLSEVVARHCLRTDGWRIRKLEAVWSTDRRKSRAAKVLKYFDEAKRDGLSILIHGYRDEKTKRPAA